MPGSVLVCARPLPNPHRHTSTFKFSGSGYHKRGGNTGSTFPRGANSDLVTEALRSTSRRSPMPYSGQGVDHGTNPL